MEKTKGAIINVAKGRFSYELKEIILLDKLFVRSKDSKYCESAKKLRWNLAVALTDYIGLSPESEEYYILNEDIDFVLKEYVECQTSKAFEKVLDNLN